MTNNEQAVEKPPIPKKSNISRVLFWVGVFTILGLGAWQAVHFWSLKQVQIETKLQEITAKNQQQSEQIQLLETSLETLSSQLMSNNTESTIKLAEVEYLIHLAEHRLRYFQDSKTATHILNSAKEKLESFENPEIQLLQEKLNAVLLEIQRSEAKPLSDIIASIDQVITALSTVPVSRAERISNASPKPAQISNWQAGLQQTWEHLKKLFVVKHIDDTVKPFLWPEERTLMLWNIRLELEQAKLALWRGDDKVYTTSLQNTVLWIKQYFNTEEEPLRKILQDLEILSKVSLATPEPHFEEIIALIQKILEKTTP